MYSALIYIYATGQDPFYLLISDTNVTHLQRRIYAVANDIIFHSLNVKKVTAELSTGEKRDFVKPTLLTEDERNNAVLEWYKP